MNVRMMALAILAAGLAGCSGDDDDDGGSPALSAGTYVFANVAENSNSCTPLTPGVADANETEVVLGSGNNLTISGTPYTLDGTSLTGGVVAQAQVLPNCLIDVTVTDAGTVTGTDEAHINEVIDASNPVGADCAGLGVTFPCTIDFDFDIRK